MRSPNLPTDTRSGGRSALSTRSTAAATNAGSAPFISSRYIRPTAFEAAATYVVSPSLGVT